MADDASRLRLYAEVRDGNGAVGRVCPVVLRDVVVADDASGEEVVLSSSISVKAHDAVVREMERTRQALDSMSLQYAKLRRMADDIQASLIVWRVLAVLAGVTVILAVLKELVR